ncbi:MAG TPA: hypothetical protein VGG39_21135 [Polyangiaceae bacterium]|jgi:hypothetical protein
MNVAGRVARHPFGLSLAAACALLWSCNDVYGAAPVPPPPPSAPPAAVATSQAPRQVVIEDEAFALTGAPDEARTLLQRHAAKLIACPPEQVKVRHTLFSRHWESWGAFLADGCGQRVVYGEADPYSSSDPAEPRYDNVTYLVISRFPLGAARGP